MRVYRYLDLITAAFVAVLLVSNLASTKLVLLGPFAFDGGTILFPLAYIFGDILTEVYGYRRSRRVIWTGFGLLAVATLTFAFVAALPPVPGAEAAADSFGAVLGLVPRIALGSLVAYLAGEFLNAYVLARLKLATGGRAFWLRALSSTALGQAVDTAVFLLIAFGGVFAPDLLLGLFVSNYVFKLGMETVLLPLTYRVVNGLKRAEGIDAFDRGIDFNPFALRERSSA